MRKGKAYKIFGADSGKNQCEIPLSFLRHLSSSPTSQVYNDIKSNKSCVIKGNLKSNYLEGKFYAYENKDAVTVINHDDFEEESNDLSENQSELLSKILFVLIPEYNLILLDKTQGITNIIRFMNGALDKSPLKEKIEAVHYENLLNYKEPSAFLGKFKNELKKIEFSLPMLNLSKLDESLLSGIKNEEDVIVKISLSRSKRGKALPPSLPEDILELLDKADKNENGKEIFKSFSAIKTDGYREILLSSHASFEIECENDNDVFTELKEAGDSINDEYGPQIAKNY